MTIKTRKIREDDILRALEKGLEGAPLQFSLTDGQVEHLASSAREARLRRVAREAQRRVA